MKKFNGQKVPGNLFGVEEEVTLPKFDFLFEEYQMNVEQENDHKRRYFVDILAQTEHFCTVGIGTSWVVETKLRSPQIETVNQVNAYGQISKSIPWLVAFDRIPASTQARAKELKVMYTGFSEYEELKKVVESTST